MLQWAEIMPLHSSLGNKSKTVSKKKYFRSMGKKMPFVMEGLRQLVNHVKKDEFKSILHSICKNKLQMD